MLVRQYSLLGIMTKVLLQDLNVSITVRIRESPRSPDFLLDSDEEIMLHFYALRWLGKPLVNIPSVGIRQCMRIYGYLLWNAGMGSCDLLMLTVYGSDYGLTVRAGHIQIATLYCPYQPTYHAQKWETYITDETNDSLQQLKVLYERPEKTRILGFEYISLPEWYSPTGAFYHHLRSFLHSRFKALTGDATMKEKSIYRKYLLCTCHNVRSVSVSERGEECNVCIFDMTISSRIGFMRSANRLNVLRAFNMSSPH